MSLQQAISDSNTTAPRFALDNINYIRNSVKATVDAYDGSVTLYAWDAEDPILQAWQNVYPSTVEPISEMSGELMSHVRYPTDLFKVQRYALGVYHVDDAQSFYQRDNAWQTPNDPQLESVLQPPYYLTMQMPGQDEPTYSMFTSFIPAAEGTASRNVLMGYLAVDSNAGDEAGVKSEDYGTLRMLVVDSDMTIPGPGQVQNTFNSDPLISSQINLLRAGAVRGAQRQPADASRRRRAALRAAGVRAGLERHSAASAAEGARRVRQRRRLRRHPQRGTRRAVRR